jgi:two-component system sensor histidine kinase RegB
VRLTLAVRDGFAHAVVEDEGHGMPEEILSKAGEPFFTTKIPGEGMGLGLFLTQTLAVQLGGSLDLRSTPGRGTAATLRLPAVPRGVPGEAP